MQPAFTAALLDADRALPPGLKAADTTERFSVYRNNVVSGLSRALASGFPAVRSIVGEEFFMAMAAVFVRVAPPASPVLLDYGATLPDFIASFTPAADLPYLADVARLELAYTRAFHAADAEPLQADLLSCISPDRLGALRLVLHPSLQILHGTHPAATIWAMNTDRLPLAEITDWSAEDILVLRPAFTVDVCVLAPGEAVFLGQLQAGECLASAAGAALDAAAGFDLGAALAALFTRGALIAFDEPAQDQP